MPYKPMAAMVAAAVTLMVYSQWSNTFLLLVASISIAWVLLAVIALKNVAQPASATSLLRSFRRKLDHAHQQIGSGAKLDNQTVLDLFDELAANIDNRLEKRTISMARLKREIIKFTYPVPTQRPYWQPSSLIDLGYMLHIGERYTKGVPVFGIYQLIRKLSDEKGAVISTFENMRADTSTALPSTIRIGTDGSRWWVDSSTSTNINPGNTLEYRRAERENRAATN